MTIKYILKQTLNGEQIINTLHYRDVDGQAPLTPDETAVLIAGLWQTHLAPWLSDAHSLTGIDWVDPDAGGGQPAVPAVVPALPIVGQQAFPSMSNRVAALINWKSSENAPWKGRTNLSGWYEQGMQPGNNFSLEIITGVNAFAFNALVLDDGNGKQGELVLRSRKSNVIPVGTVSKVTSGEINFKPKTIKSRG